MPSAADTAARVGAAGVPVLFLDTCAIVDVIRAPLPDRRAELSGCVEAAGELVAMASAACSLVVASFVPGEWAANHVTELDKLTKHLGRMDEEAEHFHDLCGHVRLRPGFGRPGYGTSGLAARLRDLSRQLLDAAVVLDRHPGADAKAVDRVVATRRPSVKGGEPKDCIIFEECLELCRHLRATSFGRKLVFCSSDKAAYRAGGAAPHPDIKSDCDAVGLQFTANLPWAVHELKS